MTVKKSQKANLENKRTIFLEIGTIVTLSFVLLAFEWTTVRSEKDIWTDWSGKTIEEDMIVITVQKDKKPIMPLPLVTPIIVPDDTELDIDDFPEIDAGINDGDYNDIDRWIPEIKEIEEEDDVVYQNVQNLPEFPGGEPALFKYLSANLKYTHAAREIGIQGKMLVSFVVWKDGTIRDIKIVRGLGAGLDDEAVRVIQSMPRWNPGNQNGKKLNVLFHMPVSFKLN